MPSESVCQVARSWVKVGSFHKRLVVMLTLNLLMSYIHGAPCKARNFNVVYIYRPAFGNAESRLFLFSAQCFNNESMQKVILCHSCV
jgi:hypothetical protein